MHLVAARGYWPYCLLFNKLMPADQNVQTEFLSLKELAGLLGISGSAARRLVDGRAIPFYKFGGCLRFAKKDVSRFIEQNRFGALV